MGKGVREKTSRKRASENITMQPGYTKMKIVEFFLPWVAIALSIGTLFYTIFHDVRMENIESYRDTLNYILEVKEAERNGKITNLKDLPDKKIAIISYKGGVDDADLVYYEDNRYIAVVNCELSNKIDHGTYSATEVYPEYRTDLAPLYTKIQSSKDANKESLYIRFFIIIWGYEGDRYFEAVIMEYPIDDGEILPPDIRTYSMDKILYTKGRSSELIPSYDLEALRDLETIVKDTNAIYN